MLSVLHLAELEHALAALSAVAGARLTERLGEHAPLPPTGSAPQPELAGLERLPSPEAFAGSGPLATVVGDIGLTVAEALVLTATIATELDERYAAILGLLSGRPGAPAALTGEGARTLMALTPAGRYAAAARLTPAGPLRAAGLVTLDPAESSGEAVLAARLRVDPEVGSWLLGRRRELPIGTANFPATPLRTVHGLDDLVVSAEARRSLTALVARIRDRGRIADEWGFGRHHDGAGGVVAMFHGPSGTGKSMAAAVVAQAVGLAAFRVDLSMLVSKYIGETEKNLATVFDVAEASDCVLVFDEADAVFGSRTEIGDARDRYANQEVSYLLQRIERHPGVVILTTNLSGNIDDAFRRRIAVSVPFPAPSSVEREVLWSRVFPPELPVDRALDLRLLAERFDLTGAQIRDATVEAAFLAADNGQVVTADHLETAIAGQYAKASRMIPTTPGW